MQSLFPVFEKENNNTCHFHILHSQECFWDSGLQTLTNKIFFSFNFFFFKQVEKTICCTRVNDFSLEDEVIWSLSTCYNQDKAYLINSQYWILLKIMKLFEHCPRVAAKRKRTGGYIDRLPATTLSSKTLPFQPGIKAPTNQHKYIFHTKTNPKF